MLPKGEVKRPGEYDHAQGCPEAVQPMPCPNGNPAIWDLVIAEMQQRDRKGLAKYGTRLQGDNGRDALRDAYEEALDLCVYLRQAIWEREEALATARKR